jgi:Sulfotransferase domain
LQKVFCIGFHKTGTKSLSAALTALGYRVTGPNGTQDPDIARNVYAMAFDLVTRFDAFQDNPWPIIYKELDRHCPGSKFVLTIRSSETWIESQLQHFGAGVTPMRQWIYGAGCPEGNEELYLRRFESHNREVLAYFKDRPADLLVMNLAEGDGWEKLCAFLGKERPEIPFPRKNRATERKNPRPRAAGQ